jgi:hypothetical protein
MNRTKYGSSLDYSDYELREKERRRWPIERVKHKDKENNRLRDLQKANNSLQLEKDKLEKQLEKLTRKNHELTQQLNDLQISNDIASSMQTCRLM